MYFSKTPRLVQRLFPNFTWRIPTGEKVLYLTFDDGPIPGVTPWVAEELRRYHAKATFFCVGDNVRKHPEEYACLLEEGHVVGNHTFNHLNGWSEDHVTYLENVDRCAGLVKSRLFRPPYGRLLPRQTCYLQREYDIVMWDVLSGDFDQKLTGRQCFQNVADHASPGSIVVFHDSIKTMRRLEYALPRTLEHFSSLGYTFGALEMQPNEAAAPVLERA